MDKDMNQMLEDLSRIEVVAEDILAGRRELIDLDRQRNKTREAMRALQQDKGADKKAWICAGKMFLKVDQKKAVQMLSKDYDILDGEMSRVRTSLKVKVNELHDLEHKDHLKGFNLSPLSSAELKSVQSLL
ncbi:p53 and DNA damage-regulated protein 1-like [Physella acuta]|uniref:p53 and DNA damage-regulated protein 1-like n=1 Tax=Physella acuta TaxID=109671 RepID=UPI0027DAD48C|nr:p53 and DNA damage-regulated protein 1-like [Physella acuta]